MWLHFGLLTFEFSSDGDREPQQPQQGTTGGATCRSGAANELWSYGPAVYEICKKYLFIREELRGYTREIMKAAHERGAPVMRPLFYDFPRDPKSWEVGEQYMYGPKYLCCPVLEPGQRKMKVYLPPLEAGGWRLFGGGQQYEGGRRVEVECPLEVMPVFERYE